MKRIITLLRFATIGVATSSLISCDGGGSDSPIPDTNTSTISTTSSQTAAAVFVDPAAQNAVDNFVIEANNRGIDVGGTFEFSVLFDDLGGSIAGICYPDSKQIVLDNFYRDNTANLEELIFHELGHCVLGMLHRPNSIMQQAGFIGISQATLDEFFNPAFFGQFDNDGAHLKFF